MRGDGGFDAADGFDIAKAVVGVGDDFRVGIGQRPHTPHGIIGAREGVSRAVDGFAVFGDTALVVIFKFMGTGRVLDFCEASLGMRNKNIVVGVGDIGFARRKILQRNAVQGIIGEADDLAFGIGLGREVVVQVIGVRPRAHVRIVHACFAGQRVVGDRSVEIVKLYYRTVSEIANFLFF